MKQVDIQKIDAHIIAQLKDHIRFLSELVSVKSDLIELLSEELQDLKTKAEGQRRAVLHKLSPSKRRS